MTQDVEKRWNDPRTARKATMYVGGVIIAALVVMGVAILWGTNSGQDCSDATFAVCADPARQILVFGPTLVLLLGGLGALLTAYRTWKRGGRWPIWQGAGWALLVLMVAYATISARAII
ncbi:MULTISPECIES: hypothetical protein [Rhodococcus]|uniref:Membrane protein n=1 Tax=Rhodococcus pyridinivorans KG-16 TaxID=1441730 RepID=A0A0V9URB8_9NOCA|nr:hypothetical protein [Rhodococcus sp. RDE2]KSZ60528.1 membrane protein [Rhodococcus pyridinivorans KG-16]BDB61975.1 hypothetical protein RDE2_37690 [Rhodococcus sp. RDE2]